MVYSPNPIYPAVNPLRPQTYSNTVRTDVANWVTELRKEGSNTTLANTYPGVISVAGAYWGGVYSPSQNRVYLVPRAISNPTLDWQYIDCNTGTVVTYTHGATVGVTAYAGGVYSPTQNRVYLVPLSQATDATWHYIDCNISSVIASPTVTTGLIVPYANGVSAQCVTTAYVGGVYSPTQNRIYFVPRNQSTPTQTFWHYVDCNTGTIGSYTHGATVVLSAYDGGVYCPTQNRIYFVPYAQATLPTWHYVDCNTGLIVPYTQNFGATIVSQAYLGGVFSPIQNRIYFVPRSQSDQSTWHYIDCNTGTVVAYIHGFSFTSQAYVGGVFSPTQNRIYFVPFFSVATVPVWHYIDCDTGTVVAYTHGVTTAVTSAYIGGVYSPTENRIYFVPFNQATTTTWNYLDMQSSASTPKTLMAGTLFNKF